MEIFNMEDMLSFLDIHINILLFFGLEIINFLFVNQIINILNLDYYTIYNLPNK